MLSVHAKQLILGIISFVCLGIYQNLWALEPSLLSKEQCFLQFQTCSCRNEGCVPEFQSKIEKLTPERIDALKKGTWEEGCPIALVDIRSLSLLYIREDGTVHEGELIVAKQEAENIVAVFRRLYLQGFVIHSMKSVENYGGNDDLSMADNNTSALNCRKVKGTTKWSEHSYGLAIDINPLWNPYVRKQHVEPPEGVQFLDRSLDQEGLIKKEDPIIDFFADIGWKWGGYWTNSKDYQHFSLHGK